MRAFNSRPFFDGRKSETRVKFDGELVFDKNDTVKCVHVYFVNRQTNNWTLLGVWYGDKTIKGFYPAEVTKRPRALLESLSRVHERRDVSLSPLSTKLSCCRFSQKLDPRLDEAKRAYEKLGQ